MSKDFARVITLLRKECSCSQKKVANDLGISQSLLSHYEKGVRECGLDFVVKIADYYKVSCDYLLGRTLDRSGNTLKIEDIPDSNKTVNENVFKGSLLPALNKKLIINSINIIFDLLNKIRSKDLTSESSSLIMSSIYKVFRIIYSSNIKNPQGLFSIPCYTWEGFSNSLELISQTKTKCIVSNKKLEGFKKLSDYQRPNLSPEIISKEYPLFASSLYNLIQTTENKMGAKKQKISSTTPFVVKSRKYE